MKKALERLCFLDGEDDPFIRTAVSSAQFYFKRELLRDRHLRDMHLLGWVKNALLLRQPLDVRRSTANVLGRRPVGLLSLNLTVNEHDHPAAEEKKYDISFIAGSTNPDRLFFARMLREFARRSGYRVFVHVSGAFYGAVSWRDYVRITSGSKICVSLPGLGFDTIRYWEAPYYGAVLASPRLPIEIEDNFEDMDSAIFFSSFEEFRVKATKVLESGLWEEILKRGKELFAQCHTSRRRAEKVLSVIRRAGVA